MREGLLRVWCGALLGAACVACGNGSEVGGSALENEAGVPPLDFTEHAAFQEALDFQEDGALRFPAVFDEGEEVEAFDTWQLALDESTPGIWRLGLQALKTEGTGEANAETLVYEGLLVIDTESLTEEKKPADVGTVGDAYSFVKEGGVAKGALSDANWPSTATQFRVLALLTLSINDHTSAIEAGITQPTPAASPSTNLGAVAKVVAPSAQFKVTTPVDYSEAPEDEGGQGTPSHAQEQCIGGFDTVKAENQGYAVRGERRSCWAWVLGTLGAVGASIAACSVPCIVGGVAGAAVGAPAFGIGAIPGAIAGCVGATVASAVKCVAALAGTVGAATRSLCCQGNDVPNAGYTGCACGEQFADTNYDGAGYSYSMPKRNNPHRQCVHCPRGTTFVQEAQNGAGACVCDPNDPGSKPEAVKCGSQTKEGDEGNDIYAREAVCGPDTSRAVCQDVFYEFDIEHESEHLRKAREESGDNSYDDRQATVRIRPPTGMGNWVSLPNLIAKGSADKKRLPYTCVKNAESEPTLYEGFAVSNRTGEYRKVEKGYGFQCAGVAPYYPGSYRAQRNFSGNLVGQRRFKVTSTALGPTYWCTKAGEPIGPKPPHYKPASTSEAPNYTRP